MNREPKNEILRWKAILRNYKLGFEDIIYTQNPIASRMEIKTFMNTPISKFPFTFPRCQLVSPLKELKRVLTKTVNASQISFLSSPERTIECLRLPDSCSWTSLRGHNFNLIRHGHSQLNNRSNDPWPMKADRFHYN